MIRILLCDDDVRFMKKLHNAVRSEMTRLGKAARIHTFTCGKEIPREEMESCDIAFLDIDFQGEEYTGIDIAKRLRALRENCIIIFVTSYIEYAPEGYELQIFRYLLKNEVEKKLLAYIQQAIDKLQEVHETLQVCIAGETVTISLPSVLYIESRAHIAVAHVQDFQIKTLKKYEFYATLTDLEAHLSNYGFMRIHKSYLVNMRRLKKLQCTGAVLDNEIMLPVSERNYSDLKKKYLQWKGGI